MKKLLVLTVSFLLALGCSNSASAARSGDVMRLTNRETAEFCALLDKDPQSMDDFFHNAGILVVTGEGEEPPVNLEADFHLAVQAGEVLVNGQVCTMRGKKLRPGDTVSFRGEEYAVAYAHP